jgi:hypothetical protein
MAKKTETKKPVEKRNWKEILKKRREALRKQKAALPKKGEEKPADPKLLAKMRLTRKSVKRAQRRVRLMFKPAPAKPAEGDAAAAPAAAATAELIGGASGHTVDAHAIQPVYTGILARDCGLTLTAAPEGETVVITAR